MRNDISLALGQSLQGSRNIRITFLRGASHATYHLLYMAQLGLVTMSTEHREALAKANSSGGWRTDAQRTVEATLTNKFTSDDAGTFVDKMYRFLEKIEVVSK